MNITRITISFLAWLCLAPLACEHHAAEHHEVDHEVVLTSPLQKDVVATQQYVCQIHSRRHIELRALERGYLEEIFVDEGQLIEEGQLMFQVMPIIYQAEVSRAKAEVDLAHIELKNAELLAEKNVISPSELALARAKYNKAKAELSLASAHRRLTEVHAPFTGIMGRFEVRKGSLLDEGELLTTMSDNSKVWVYFNVSEREYLDYKANTKEGETTTVKLRMANGELFDQPGVIETIEADFNNETGNIAFRAGFPNPKGLLRHGETGNVLMTIPYPKALIIPQKSTFEVLDKRYVFVVDDKGGVKTRSISVAAEQPHRFIIDGGLEETDHILLEGLRKVRDGDTIETEYQDPETVFASIVPHAE